MNNPNDIEVGDRVVYNNFGGVPGLDVIYTGKLLNIETDHTGNTVWAGGLGEVWWDYTSSSMTGFPISKLIKIPHNFTENQIIAFLRLQGYVVDTQPEWNKED